MDISLKSENKNCGTTRFFSGEATVKFSFFLYNPAFFNLEIYSIKKTLSLICVAEFHPKQRNKSVEEIGSNPKAG